MSLLFTNRFLSTQGQLGPVARALASEAAEALVRALINFCVASTTASLQLAVVRSVWLSYLMRKSAVYRTPLHASLPVQDGEIIIIIINIFNVA